MLNSVAEHEFEKIFKCQSKTQVMRSEKYFQSSESRDCIEAQMYETATKESCYAEGSQEHSDLQHSTMEEQGLFQSWLVVQTGENGLCKNSHE